MSDKTVYTTFDAIKNKINSLEHRLIRLHKVLRELYLGNEDSLKEVSDPSGIDNSQLDEA